jgi:hypothetical protein
MHRRYTLAFLSFLTAMAAPEGVRINVLSNRPDMLSGGDALIGVDLPEQSAAIKLNGADVTSVFQTGVRGHTLTGLVTGLKPGRNLIQVFQADNTQAAAELELTNHPISGPVFSGPQEEPFLCQTYKFKLPDGAYLGNPLDVNCSVDAVVTYVYRSTEGGIVKVLPTSDSLPADVATTTTSLGRTVPYVVRIETGTINRAIYQIAMLHNPIAQPSISVFEPSNEWNQRLLYSFGGGCPGGWNKQGTSLGTPAVNDAIVGKGYASASATLNVFGNNCQDITAAETMMMVKEHFIESYGAPLFTFGRGGSGGSYQQIQIAGNYPGLLDGIIPSATFPDVQATIQFLADIQLLNRYYSQSAAEFTGEQKRAIAGVGNIKSVSGTAAGAKRIQATGGCPPEIPIDQRYDPVTNPGGARCNVYDHTINAYGHDPVTGFARRPVDNTGVQYGLSALNEGVVSVAQFLALNEAIGGYDNDGNMVASRAVGDPLALRAAYETGRITSGGAGLANVPIIDWRGYLDAVPAGNLHLKYHSFAFRERLRRANGTIANEVLLVTGDKSPKGFEHFLFARMDEWLTTLAGDKSNDPAPVKIARAKPADLVDSCYSPSGDRIVEIHTLTGGECNKLYPTYPSPRMIAGGPITNDVLKCQLKPIDFSDYRASFTDEEKARIQTIFPVGVCDWSKPGVDQRPMSNTWLKY